MHKEEWQVEQVQESRSYPEGSRSVSLGKTGLRVSRLCFGTAWMGPLSDHMSPEAGADLLCQAFELGITFWDTSDDYGTHPHVAYALRRVPREQVVVASKTYEPERAVESILAELGTAYLDILLVHGVGLDRVEPARQALRSCLPDREAGRIRALGFSTHSAEVARRAAGWPEIEVLMLPFNRTGVCTSDLSIEDGGVEDMLLAGQEVAEAGKGVIGMKVYGCGTLAREGKAALTFVATLPFVHSLCIGMRRTDEIDRNIAWLGELEGSRPAASILGEVIPGETDPEEARR